MKVALIIAGSRGFPRDVASAYLATIDPSTVAMVISGTCTGPDVWGEEWASSVGLPIKRMPADWNRGKRAGPERNRRMLEFAGAHGGGLLAFWDNMSRGTKHIIETAKAMGVVVRVVSPSWKQGADKVQAKLGEGANLAMTRSPKGKLGVAPPPVGGGGGAHPTLSAATEGRRQRQR